MEPVGDELAAGFGSGFGMYIYDGVSWTSVSPWETETVEAVTKREMERWLTPSENGDADVVTEEEG